jgi:hypothetical protein
MLTYADVQVDGLGLGDGVFMCGGDEALGSSHALQLF